MLMQLYFIHKITNRQQTTKASNIAKLTELFNNTSIMYQLGFISLVSLVTAIIAPIAASPLSKRGTAQDVISDINAINSGVLSLTGHVSSYNSGAFPTGLVGGVPILADVVDIHVSNRKGYLDATTASKFSADDSDAIVNTVSSTVVTSIPNSVDVLKSKKQVFQQALLTPVVIASLELLLNDHDTFSAAVVDKLTVDAATLAQANDGIAKIHNALVDGIAYFSQ